MSDLDMAVPLTFTGAAANKAKSLISEEENNELKLRVYITGGGSKIHNLDKLFTEITNIKVNSCENPEECAVRGLNKIVSDEKYKHLGFSMKSKIYK